MKNLTSSQKKSILSKITLCFGLIVFTIYKDKFSVINQDFFIWLGSLVTGTLIANVLIFHVWNKNTEINAAFISRNKTLSYDVFSSHFQEKLGINKQAELLIKQKMQKIMEDLLIENENFISEYDYQQFLEKKSKIISESNNWIREGITEEIKMDKKIVEISTGLKYEGELFLTHNDIVKLIKNYKSKDEESTYSLREAYLNEIKEICSLNSGKVSYSDIREMVLTMDYDEERFGVLHSRKDMKSITVSEKIQMDFENIIHDIYQQEKQEIVNPFKNMIGLSVVK